MSKTLIEWAEECLTVRRELVKTMEQRNALLAACQSLVSNLPDEIFEWIGDSISWSNVAAIKNARQAAEDAIAAVTKNE